MKWEAIKLQAARELRHKIDLQVVTGSGEPHLALCRLVREMCDGFDLPPAIRKVLASEGTLGRALVRAAQGEVDKIVDRWDIRAVGRLRQLIPEAFPASLRSGNLLAEIGEKGAWEVFPAQQSRPYQNA